MSLNPIKVLLVEDDPEDVKLTVKLLESSKINPNISVVEDGEEAMIYLNQSDHHEKAERPDLVLLDLNLPKKDGRDVLREIKTREDLRTIPVMILTTSDENRDILKSYGLGANCYVTKPNNYSDFVRVMKAIEDFWFETASIPKEISLRRKKKDESDTLTTHELRLLLIEDDEEDATLFSKAAMSHPNFSIQIDVSPNLSSALIQLKKTAYDIIFLDLMLPDSEGLEGLDTVSLNAPRIPVIVLTGVEDLRFAEESLKRGAIDFVFKSSAQFTDPNSLHRVIHLARARKKLLEMKLHQNSIDAHSFTQESRALKKELQQVKVDIDNLTAKNATVTKFVSMAAHDLKEPLVSISTYLQLLKLECGQHWDSKGNELYQSATQSTERLVNLIDDMLDYSSNTSDKISIKPINVHKILLQLVNEYKLQNSEKDIHIDLLNLPIEICADESSLFRVFKNLISNSIKFNQNKQIKISVSATNHNNEWIFSVKDNGIGFDMKYSTFIFGMMNRLNPQSTYSGSGIGLAIVKTLVEKHGGRLWVESSLGIGSNFFFTIPIQQILTPLLFGFRILVVDDSTDYREFVSILLEREKPLLHFAKDGNEAVSLVAKNVFDVILMDIELPGISGVEVKNIINSNGVKTPIIAMTGHSNGKHFKNLGFDEYIAKDNLAKGLIPLLSKFNKNN